MHKSLDFCGFIGEGLRKVSDLIKSLLTVVEITFCLVVNKPGSFPMNYAGFIQVKIHKYFYEVVSLKNRFLTSFHNTYNKLLLIKLIVNEIEGAGL